MPSPKKRRVIVGKYGRPKKKKSIRIKFRFTRKFFYLTALLAIAGGIFYFLFISDNFEIKEVNISGLKTISEENVQSTADAILREERFGFIKATNYFIFPKDKLRAAILISHPKIEGIDIQSTREKVEISITERKTLGVWCKENDCFYFDKAGVIFENAPKSVGSLVISISDERDIDVNIGSIVLDEQQVDLAETVHGLIGRNFSFGIRTIVIAPDGEVEVLTSENWRLLLEKDDDIEYQLSNLKYVLDEEIKARRGELEYVDLRLGNKVYYKYLKNID